MDVIMVGPWKLSSQNGLDPGRHHGWAMDALFSEPMEPSSFCVNYFEETYYLDPGWAEADASRRGLSVAHDESVKQCRKPIDTSVVYGCLKNEGNFNIKFR